MNRLSFYHRHLEHEGGTKDYDCVVLINDRNEKAILVQRWGKIDSKGQSKIVEFKHFNQARAYENKVKDGKCDPSKGYRQEDYSEQSGITFDEFYNGAPKAGKIVLDHVQPHELAAIGFDIDGVFAGGESVTSDEDQAIEEQQVHEMAQAQTQRPTHYATW